MPADNKVIKYQVQPADLERCFKFSVEYHLYVGGANYNRTTGQYRGLGGIFDNFLIGKLVEIGAASIIEKYTSKRTLLDFEIHGPTDEPDIIKVEEDGVERTPNLYVEIKNAPLADRWIGLSKEQFDTILKNKLVKGDPAKAFIVGASLVSQNDQLDEDLLGVYLKTKWDSEILGDFCEIEDLQVVLHHVVNIKELKEKGVKFKKETSYMYETEVLRPASDRKSRQIIEAMSKGKKDIYQPLNLKNNILPIIMRDNYPKPKEFGKFKYEGDLIVFLKENEKSKREYIYCETDVKIENDVLGVFELEKGKIYECFFKTIGRSPVLKRDNIWIAQRNLDNVLSQSKEKGIKEIAEKI